MTIVSTEPVMMKYIPVLGHDQGISYMSIGSLIIATVLPTRGFIQENDPVYALNRHLTC